MSFKALFKVAGKEYRVMSCAYDLKQLVSATGRPTSTVHGGNINVSVESTKDTFLFEWMCNSYEKKDGSVVFLKPDSDATMKELKFKEAYLTNFQEVYSADTNYPMKIEFTISAKELSMGDGDFKNEWPEV